MSAKKGRLEFFEVYRSSSLKGTKEKPVTEPKDLDQTKGTVKATEQDIRPKELKYVRDKDKSIPKTGGLKSESGVSLPLKKKDEPEKTQNISMAPKIPKVPNIQNIQNISMASKIPNVPKIQNISRAPKIPDKPNVSRASNIPNIPKRENRITETEVKMVEKSPDQEEKFIHKDEVRLKQETIIIGAVAATFLSLACFFIGYKVGYNKGVFADPSVPAQVSQVDDDIIDNNKKPANKNFPLNLYTDENKRAETYGIKRAVDNLWTLRMISYKNSSSNLLKATNLAKAIKKMTGVNAFVAKTGNELIVCAGKYKDSKNQELTELQVAMADLVYENKKQFSGCYPVKLR